MGIGVIAIEPRVVAELVAQVDLREIVASAGRDREA
jgi:hypothetical protein